ncbi:MAG: histidine-type phosphatase [Acidobacteriota bacterium]|nr:histidine-type phosphatase [Acidobacteriota bacterium]
MTRRLALLFLVVCFGLALSLEAQSAPAAPADNLQLEQVVLVSRHGVRSPTNTRPPLAQVAAEPWPTWPVGPGELTPHGQHAATLMGAYYRSAFAQAGLLAPAGCPRANDLYVWSDVEQRTRLTAQALMDGMYPGCGLKPNTKPDLEKDDPLFHPTTTGVCKVDGQTARAAILGRIGGGNSGGDFTALLRAYAEQFARMQSVLKCCAPTLCAPGSASCTLAQVPASISAEGRLQGPIPIASTATEIFLLEYAQGLPADQVGWGRVDESTLRYLMQLHQLQFELAERTMYPAQRAGSNLLDQVLSTLRAKVSGPKFSQTTAPRAQAPAASKTVLYVGHDTNIANLGGMLNVDWLLEGYQANETPPDGAIAFELFRGKPAPQMKTPQYFVRLFYYAQSPAQLREATKLDATHPPSRAEITIPGCAAAAAKAGAGMACPWPVFERIAAAAIDRECVGGGSATAQKRIVPTGGASK